MLFEMMQYLIERSQDFTTALQQHLVITLIALAISVVLGLVLGVLSTRFDTLRALILAIANFGRTLPSLAVLALALPFLGIGRPPTVLALVFIGTLPILLNAYVGIKQVHAVITESARGMGMSDRQILWKVELPIALPVIMAGIRTSAVLVVASTTLAAFIGGGGLGDLILRGHALGDEHVMLAGAVPATLLAFYFEETFGRLERVVTPRGLREEEPEAQPHGDQLLPFFASVMLMPLIFGAMLPWEQLVAEGNETLIFTGLHPAYRAIGVPALLLGLLAALWPRNRESRYAIPLVAGASVLALLWMAIGLLSLSQNLPSGTGLYLQFGAVAGLVIITLLEYLLYHRQKTDRTAEMGDPGLPVTSS